MTIEEITKLVTQRNTLLQEREYLMRVADISIQLRGHPHALQLSEDEMQQVARLLGQNRTAKGRQIDIQLRAGGIDVPIETAS
jgi:hypothetical protein